MKNVNRDHPHCMCSETRIPSETESKERERCEDVSQDCETDLKLYPLVSLDLEF